MSEQEMVKSISSYHKKQSELDEEEILDDSDINMASNLFRIDNYIENSVTQQIKLNE